MDYILTERGIRYLTRVNSQIINTCYGQMWGRDFQKILTCLRR